MDNGYQKVKSVDIYVIIAKKRDQINEKLRAMYWGGGKAFEGTFNQPFRNELQKLLLSHKKKLQKLEGVSDIWILEIFMEREQIFMFS